MKPKFSKYLAAVTLALFTPCLMRPALGQQVNDKSTVNGTAHDISALGGGCFSCHVPHNALSRGTMAWAPAYSTTVFGVYDSPTLDSMATEIGSASYSGSNPPAGAKLNSVLCMSCHDGVTTPTVIGPSSGVAVGNLANSGGLTNDHPINMAFDPNVDAGLKAIAVVTATNVRLYDEAGTKTVQCGSCHDPHNAPGLGKFLRVENSGSGLCITCHQ